MRYFHFMTILIFSGVAQKRRVTAVEGYREKTVNHSIYWVRAIYLVQCDDYESFTIPTGADIKDKREERLAR